MGLVHSFTPLFYIIAIPIEKVKEKRPIAFGNGALSAKGIWKEER
jgi:hypothetical protein